MASVKQANGRWTEFLFSRPAADEAAELTTPLYKRSLFNRDLQAIPALSQDQAWPVACLLVDVDNFKSFNDRYSHQTGDKALSLVSLHISQLIQGRGRGYRYGGEEFVVLLPNTGLGEAAAFGERLRSCVAKVEVSGVDIALTISIGVSSYPDPAPTPAELFSQADKAVHVAKERGKNQVRAFGVRRLSEVEAQTLAEWEAAFVAYRRAHLKPFAECAREAYRRFRGAASHLPETWEEATHSAKWPRNLPMPGNPPLRLWWVQFGIGLDAEDENLFKFAESIYPPFNSLDPRPLRERSILTSSEFDVFDKARGGLADYFSLCGDLMLQTPAFADFLEEKVRPNHYYKVKIVAYLELALLRAIGDKVETGPGKLGLFQLGALWKGDDPRK
jgi:diguanylate cyclase (GGDEF)-like protein